MSRKWLKPVGGKILAAVLGLGWGCRSPSPPGPALPAGMSLLSASNGVIHPLTLEFQQEDLEHPRLKFLRERERLEELVAGAGDELEVFTRLGDWTNAQWVNSVPDPYPPWDAVTILDWIRAGRTGGFCAQSAVVLVQACLSLGYSARYLAIAPQKGGDGGHLTVEVWSNQFNKWMVLDPFFNVRYEREGIPLSGLEIHQALVRGEADQVRVIRGRGPNGGKNSRATAAEMRAYYFHLAVDLRNNHLSRPLPLWNRGESYLSWQDDFTDGRPEIFGRFTRDPQAFNFPLNQVEVHLEPAGPDRLRVRLRTALAQAQEIEIQSAPGGSWRISLENERLALHPREGAGLISEWRLQAGENELRVRGRNSRGISGPWAVFHLRFQPPPGP